MSDEVVRFEMKTTKDPILTAYVCKRCGNVELVLEQRDLNSSQFKSIDLAIESSLREEYYSGLSGGGFTKHDTLVISFKVLVQKTNLSKKELESVLPKYLSYRQKKPLDLSGWKKFAVSESDEKKGGIVVRRWFRPT